MLPSTVGVITRGQMRIWVKGPLPHRLDAEHLMALWDEGNMKANLPGQREGDKHVRPFEEMMQGFRQLGYVGWNDDQVSPPDWYMALDGDLYDGDILARLANRGRGN